MMLHQQVFIVCLILAAFNSYSTCVASTNADSSSEAQVSRACPENQRKWARSPTVSIIADDEGISLISLDRCKEECKTRTVVSQSSTINIPCGQASVNLVAPSNPSILPPLLQEHHSPLIQDIVVSIFDNFDMLSANSSSFEK
ncbi:hypothetical protein EG68_02576 [Paragonimus skrjabini miyazakii]|uniref:Uncharacterized protein n=1 Tax=Paragonimus skrjabini miyazakii TaxID=59628 RepID=A0A8S9Z005_9TREM|nr:hypothetical protein EG68_02576 [Paragonimus skrjabini miyazakii]